MPASASIFPWKKLVWPVAPKLYAARNGKFLSPSARKNDVIRVEPGCECGNKSEHTGYVGHTGYADPVGSLLLVLCYVKNGAHPSGSKSIRILHFSMVKSGEPLSAEEEAERARLGNL